ncbi:TPA: TcpD family membrane protein, partial [Staphylococcus aureus]
MNGLFNFLVLGAERPSLGGLGDWLSNEVGTGIGLIVLIVGIVHWSTGKYGRMIILFIVGGLLFLVSKGPEQVFNAISG